MSLHINYIVRDYIKQMSYLLILLLYIYESSSKEAKMINTVKELSE